MRVLITGVAGFIGSHTAQKLLDNKHDVIGIDNFDPYYPIEVKQQTIQELRFYSHFTFHQIDIRSKELSTLINQSKPNTIIHLAAKAGVRNSIEHPQEYVDVNVGGTINILEAARQTGVNKILIASSSSVYGNNTKVPFSEKDPVESQISPYAASKRACEILCKTYAHTYNQHIQMFRFFTVYGPKGRPDMAPFLFTDAIAKGKPINVFGSLSTQRDYTYIDDIVHGLLSALNRDDIFEIYNLGNNKPIRLSKFIATIEAALNKKAKIKIFPPQPGDVEITWADITKAQHNLGYQPSISIDEGIQSFISWYKENNYLYTKE